MAKVIEDCFRSLEILEDDDVKYVARSVLEVAVFARPKGTKSRGAQGEEVDEKDADYVEVEIIPFKQSNYGRESRLGEEG